MTEPEPETDAIPESTPLTPEARAYPEANGVPLRIGDHEWLLPLMLTDERMDPIREEILEQGYLTGKYKEGLLHRAAEILIGCNHELTGEEQFWLVSQAKLDDLRDIVEECLLAHADRPREYRDWVRSCLLANGLAPELIPDADLPHVLRQLVCTGRAIPPQDFLDVAIAGGKRRALFEGLTIQPKPTPAPDPAP